MKIPSLLLCCLLSLVAWGQDTGNRYISIDSAIVIAKNNGHYRTTSTEERHDWITSQPELDTAKGCWVVTSSKMKYTMRGRTTKNFATDSSLPCRRINGCRVYKMKILYIDAKTGKVVGRKKAREVHGNYE